MIEAAEQALAFASGREQADLDRDAMLLGRNRRAEFASDCSLHGTVGRHFSCSMRCDWTVPVIRHSEPAPALLVGSFAPLATHPAPS
jgi:hypothetical protein